MSETTSDRPHLCATCGICCDGTLFSYAAIQDDEAPKMRELGIPIRSVGEQQRFSLPCVHICGTLCQVYAARPTVCRKYGCATLAALDGGKIDRMEADRRVKIVKNAAADVREGARPGESLSEALMRLRTDSSSVATLKLSSVVLELLLDRFFRGPDQQRMQNLASE